MAKKKDLGQIPGMKLVLSKEYAAKASCKYEVYQFLTISCKAYLPDYRTITMYFMKDLQNGVKECK